MELAVNVVVHVGYAAYDTVTVLPLAGAVHWTALSAGNMSNRPLSVSVR